jgi:Zn-dependent protease with chaperone function
MHLVLLAGVVAIAILIRWGALVERPAFPEIQRWQGTIAALTLPGILCLSSAMAILIMGHHGRMWGFPVNGLACLLAKAGLVWALLQAALLGIEYWRLGCWLQTLPILAHGNLPRDVFPKNTIVHYLEVPHIVAGQTGLFQSRIVVSQGLLELPSDQVQAVLAHEQAHFHYRDNLWALGINWLRGIGAWLPGSDRLWQDWLLLRECRADAHAAQSIDPLILAETLVLAVQSSLSEQNSDQTSFNLACIGLQSASDRLTYRVESLLRVETVAEKDLSFSLITIGSLLLGLLPLASIAFHHLGPFLECATPMHSMS